MPTAQGPQTTGVELDVPPVVPPESGGLLATFLDVTYDLGWLLAALVGSPWLLWKSLTAPGFANMLAARFGRGLGAVPRATRPRLLVHGVSVGEVKAARSVVTELEARYPEFEVVISTMTETGVEVARSTYPGRSVVRFPADLSFIVRRFLRRVDPVFVVLVELEVWPNFLRLCNREGRTVAVVNGRITPRSHARYVLFRRVVPQFRRISLLCVQSDEYAERFRQLDVPGERILVTGNVKVDGLRTGGVDAGDELGRLLGPAAGQEVLVAGSTHEPEEVLLAAAWRAVVPGARLILVPRHPGRAGATQQALSARGMAPQRLSELRAGREEPDPTRPALVDTIGELEGIYGLADVVFVGGSLIPHGGQNMLEPAAQGKACIFGPHVRNFTHEAGLLLEAGAARQVADETELAQALRELLGDLEQRERMGTAAMRAVSAQRGATRLTVDALAALELDRLAERDLLGHSGARR